MVHHTAQRVDEGERLAGRANGQAQSGRAVGGGRRVWRWLLL